MRDIALRMKPTRDAACAQRATALSRIPEKLPASEVLRPSPAEKGLLQKTNLRQALIYIHFHTEDRILAQIVENFSHFGHAYAGSTVLVGPES